MVAKRAAVVAAAFLAAVAACSFADLGGLSDGAGGDDAALDAGGSVEAATATDATDAADAADATTKFCATAGPHTLCDDFDTPISAGWTSFSTFGGGTGAKDTASFVSAPASFELTVPAQSADAGEAWYFPVLRVPLTTTVAHVEAKVKACATAADYVFMSVNSFTTGDASYATVDVGTRTTPTGVETFLAVKHDAFLKSFGLGAPLSSAGFSRLVLDVFLDKTSGTVKLSIDGVVVVDAKSIATDPSGVVARRSVFAGLYAYQSPACTARIDDVLIDAK